MIKRITFVIIIMLTLIVSAACGAEVDLVLDTDTNEKQSQANEAENMNSDNKYSELKVLMNEGRYLELKNALAEIFAELKDVLWDENIESLAELFKDDMQLKDVLVEIFQHAYDTFDTSRLPMHGSNWGVQTIDDFYMLGAREHTYWGPFRQYFHQTPEAYMLSEAMSRYFFFHDFILPDFDALKDIENEEDIFNMQKLAAHHTQQVFADREKENHIITFLADYNSKIDNKGASAIYYKDDVENSLLHMFGDDNERIAKIDRDLPETTMNYGSPYHYYPYAELLIRSGDYGGSSHLMRQIESYEKTGDGYICDVYFVYLGYYCSYYNIEVEEEITNDNIIDIMLAHFEQIIPQAAKYRISFKLHDDGRLTLSSLKTLVLPDGLKIPTVKFVTPETPETS